VRNSNSLFEQQAIAGTELKELPMTSPTQAALFRVRFVVVVVVVGVLGASFLTAGVSSAGAVEQGVPVVGSFGVGGGLSGGVDEGSGVFDVQVPVWGLPGVGGRGGVDVGLSYSQGLAAGGVDRFGVGAGMGWSGSFVDVDGGVKVFPASGGMYNADASKPSGLDRYVLGDLVFTQELGVLEARDGIGEVEYAYSLEYAGGVKDYFNAAGDIVARVDVFGYRTDWVWDAGASHRLVGVVDAGGSRVTVVWTGAGVEVVAPPRSDGVQARTVLEVMGSRLVSVTDPTGERVEFGYEDDGLIDRVRSGAGAVTTVSYQVLPDTSKAVDRVRVIDEATGTELSVREWDVVGERTASGWPTYPGAGALWASGDGQFRYRTQLSDGVTRVVSEYNSQGLMVGRDMVVTTGVGDVVVQEQEFVFPGTQTGGVPDPQLLPKQYAKPVSTVVVFRDSRGRAREVSEQTVFDEVGRVTKQVSADGQVTETVYDTEVPSGMLLPVGVVLEETVTGADGVVSQTVNTLTSDRKTIAATETFVGASVDALVSQSRTEMVVQPDGFVFEERVIATGEVSEGPTTVVTRFDRKVEGATVTVSESTAVGTPAQSTTSTVVDKATGLPLSTIDPVGRVATTRYDTAGRVVTEKDAAGLITVTGYGDRVTRVTDPRGVTRSEYVDVLGQVVKITDNIHGGVPQPGFERVVETRTYEQNSSKVTATDVRGLETVTVSDVFGRVREVVTPNGVRQVTEHDDVANTVSTGLVDGNGGLTRSPLVSTTVKDDTDRVVAETGTRADRVEVPESRTRYDGLGRVTEQVSQDVSTSVVLNPDGTPKTTTLSPVNGEEFVGEPVTAVREHDLLGVSTKKTLTQDGGGTRSGVSRVLDAGGRTVRETDQVGNVTEFQYTVDGLVAVIQNQGTGVVTRNTYDPATCSSHGRCLRG
jgi:YD repeat-containing protein